jgi:hypothetical protein
MLRKPKVAHLTVLPPYNVTYLEACFVFLAPLSRCSTIFDIRVSGFYDNGYWRTKYNLLAIPMVVVSVAPTLKTAFH